jgi:hypothetical protein
MAATHPARRIPVPESGDINDVIFRMEPGDYCGPIEGYSGDKPAVFFRLPELGSDDPVGGIRHVVSPPHVFTEQPDGSLEIRESILAENGWHGYLDAGHLWRQV